MPAIKSLEELKRVREEALAKKQFKTESGQIQVIIAMGTCGIAAGARDIVKSILSFIESEELDGISVTQTGCLGMCDQEPIVQVICGDQPKVIYGKVNAEIAAQIMKEHVQNGTPLKEHTLSA